MSNLRTLDIEIALAKYLDYRANLIVPNISWGLHLHEIDLLVLTPNNYAWEIEIKTSLSDLKADVTKKHGHYSNKIKRLYFAMPEELEIKGKDLIPERAGLFIIGRDKQDPSYIWIKLVKTPKINMRAIKFTEKEVNKLYELASMRIWTLKQKIQKIQKII